MQLLNEVRKNALHMQAKTRGLPALLAFGMIFVFVLSACQVAVADDGTIQIKPESTAASNGNTQTSDNTFASLLNQAGEPGTSTTAAIDPDQIYEWNGLIEWADLEGGHFIIDRGCDQWAVIPQDDELYSKLKELESQRATIWGNVSTDPNIYGRRAINATAVFAFGDVRPLIAVPEIPCPDVPPVPGQHIAINHSEITLHGDLVWRGGRLWIVTPRGNVLLALPTAVTDAVPELSDALERAQSAIEGASSDAATASFSLGEYGVVGMWELANTGLVVRVRDVKPWPVRTFVRDHCGGGYHHFVVGEEQLAAHGTLVITDAGWLLRTKSGVIYIHHSADAAFVDPETGARTAITPEVLRTHDVVVIGQWKTDGTQMHMEADQFVRVKTNCEPPQPPRQPILPGEIAALGTLVFENGQPYLNTPSGRILLFRQNASVDGEPMPADPSLFQDVAPEALTDATASAAGEDGTVDPDVARPVRYILVVGKWQIVRGQLAIFVRYALPWPYPYAQPVDPMPVPMPVPPIFELPQPQPIDPVFGFPTEPVRPDDEPDQAMPDDWFDGDVVQPESTKVAPSDYSSDGSTTASGVPVNSFTTTTK